jgi:hypothetical protein
VQVLPPEIQDLIKPGPQSDRISKAIGWAARRDPEVLRLHREHGAKQVRTLEDVRNVTLDQMDHVARHITAKYRHRAALTGALTGLPGGLWTLVAAGADVQLTAIYSVRMAAGVAQAYGYDTGQPEELTHLAEVLALVAGVDSLRGIGNWLTREGLIHYLPEVLPRLLEKIGAQITKEQATKLVGRLVPGVGAAIGGAIDYSFLRVAGDKAVAYYHQRYLVDHGLVAAQPVAPGPAVAAVPPGVGRMIPPPTRVVDADPPSRARGRAATPAAPAAVSPPTGSQVVQIPHSTPKPRERPPERFGVYLAIFAVFALFITIAACAALIILASAGVQHYFHLGSVAQQMAYVVVTSAGG